MAKEKKKEEKLVSLEMTEDQKSRVVDILAAEKPVEEEMSEVILRVAHSRNGVHYGPGKVIVEAGVAASLYSADQKAWISLLSQNDSKITHIAMEQSGLRKIVSRVELASEQSDIKKLG